MERAPRSRDARWDVVGVGANSVDFVYVLPAFPQPEGWYSKLRLTACLTTCGGQTATSLAACARFGLRAAYVGAVGSDDNGARLAEELPRRGVDASRLVVRDGTSQFALILIDERTGERAVLWDRDERLRLQAGDLPLDLIASARLLHVDDVDQDAAIQAARHARALGMPVTSDLDRLTEQTEALIATVTVPIFAEGLPEQLTGERDHERALRKLRRPHHGVLCTTLGRHGAVALEGDRFVVSPGFPVKAADTTGAGDVFRGGFIYGSLNGWALDRTLRFANAAAALQCTRLGAMAGVPDVGDVLELAETRGAS